MTHAVDFDTNPNEWDQWSVGESTKQYSRVFTIRVFPSFLKIFLVSMISISMMFLWERLHGSKILSSQNKKHFSSSISFHKKLTCKMKNLSCCFLAIFFFGNGMISLSINLGYQTSMDYDNKLGVNLIS